MTVGIFLKVLGLVLWLVAAFAPRVTQLTPWGGSLVAAGLFFFFLPDVLPL
jgi:hypothetical protein